MDIIPRDADTLGGINSSEYVQKSTLNGIKFYTTPEQINMINPISIADIVNAMPDKSMLVFSISSALPAYAALMPYINGVLEIVKYDLNRVRLHYTDTSSFEYVATYHITNGFSGWKALQIKAISGTKAEQRLAQVTVTFNSSGVATWSATPYAEGKTVSGFVTAVPASADGIAITGATTYDGINIQLKARNVVTGTAYQGNLLVNITFYLYT